LYGTYHVSKYIIYFIHFAVQKAPEVSCVWRVEESILQYYIELYYCHRTGTYEFTHYFNSHRVKQKDFRWTYGVKWLTTSLIWICTRRFEAVLQQYNYLCVFFPWIIKVLSYNYDIVYIHNIILCILLKHVRIFKSSKIIVNT